MGDIWDWIEKYESLLDDYHNIQDQLSILTDMHNDLVNKYHLAVAKMEKMRCGENCKHSYWANTGSCYDRKCRLSYCDCIGYCDKWEMKNTEDESIFY